VPYIITKFQVRHLYTPTGLREPYVLGEVQSGVILMCSRLPWKGRDIRQSRVPLNS